ncbi:MAG: hypothetical protein AB1540_15785, partial [Bdellovibrionota bacterium]
MRFVLTAFFLTSSFINGAFAKTTWIHAQGVASDQPQRNYENYYQESRAFLNSCKKRGLQIGIDCHYFADLSWRYVNGDAKKDFPDLATASPRSPTKKMILEKFSSTLDSAEEGDQVVFSLTNHGSPGVASTSCVHLGYESICVDDLSEVLKKKKPGVKVFLHNESCYGGGFAELSSKEVCVHVESTPLGPSYTRGFGTFWNVVETAPVGTLDQLKDPLFAAGWDIKNHGNWRSQYDDGGGFASEVIQNHLCHNQPKSHDWNPKEFQDSIRNALTELRTLITSTDKTNAVLQTETSATGCSMTAMNLRTTINSLSLTLEKVLSIGAPMIDLLQKKHDVLCVPSNISASLATCRMIDSLLNELKRFHSAGVELERLLEQYSNQVEALLERDDKLVAAGDKNYLASLQLGIFDQIQNLQAMFEKDVQLVLGGQDSTDALSW